MIQGLIAHTPGLKRTALSRTICERLDWRKPNGELKDMTCRVALALPAGVLAGWGATAILSHALWKQRFNSDPAVIGRTVRLDGRDQMIVGVMPDGFAMLSLWTRTRPLSLWSLRNPFQYSLPRLSQRPRQFRRSPPAPSP